jgi:hypothetical protein
MASSSEILPLLQTAHDLLLNPTVASEPKELRLASVLLHIRQLPSAPSVVGTKDDYSIVKEIAAQFDQLKNLDEKQKFKEVISALHSWTGIESADSKTRTIERIASKQLNISPTWLPNLFIWIHEQCKTLAMAVDGIPEQDRRQSINQLLSTEKTVCTILERDETRWTGDIPVKEWKTLESDRKLGQIQNILEFGLHISTKTALKRTMSIFSKVQTFIYTDKE